MGSLPVSLMIVPAKEWPTRTVGPFWRARTRRVAAAASASDVSGFCTAVTFKPAFCKCVITSSQQDPSAYRPWTNTTLRAFVAAWALPTFDAIKDTASAASNRLKDLRVNMSSSRGPSN
jgi:hypothetical protein